jgi:hypothetical protein
MVTVPLEATLDVPTAGSTAKSSKNTSGPRQGEATQASPFGTTFQASRASRLMV